MQTIKHLSTHKGFNSVTQNFIYDQVGLEFPNGALETADGVNSVSYYDFVNSKKELEDNFTYNFSRNINGELNLDDLGFTIKSELTRNIVNTTSFTSDTITIVAYWKEEEKKVHSNGLPSIKEDALNLLRDNPKQFFSYYGDKYVSGVTLGRMFYIVYQADVTNVSNSSKTTTKKALELKFKEILGGKLSTAEESFVSQKLTNVHITSKTYTYGISGFVNFFGPYTQEEFNNIKQQITDQSAVISRDFKDYSYTSNGADYAFVDTTEYEKMANEWIKHYSNLNYIYNNSRISYGLKNNCAFEMSKINDELSRVYSLDETARYPGNEVSIYANLYNTYLDELHITPRWYEIGSYTLKSGEYVNLDLLYLGDVEVLKIDAKNSNLLNETNNIYFYINKDGNLSLYNSWTFKGNVNIILYEGAKFHDVFRVKFTASDSYLSSPISQLKVFVSYKEKIIDVIWLYMNGYST